MQVMIRVVRWALLVVFATVSTGCNLLIPLAMLGKHKETIPAEFDKLEGKRTAIVVWAPQEVLFDYPFVRMELALHIGDKLRAEMEDVDIVDGRLIEDYIQRSLETYADPDKIGREFDCDVVVYVELLEFQIRDPTAPDILRARIHGSVIAYDLRADPDQSKRYELEDVITVYPENQPVLLTPTNSIVVRKEAYEKFTEMVARKFYPYDEEL